MGIGIDSWEGDARTEHAHGEPARAARAQLKALFEMHHGEFAAAQRAESRTGLLLFALDQGSGALVSHHWGKTRPQAINSVLVGRHRKCDVCLPRDQTVSLRHLAVVIHPHDPKNEGRVAYRVLDLRTGLAFQDASGNRLEALVADGPLMIAVGRYALLIAPTGSRLDVPDAMQAAWDLVADPLHVDERRVPRESSIIELSAASREDGRTVFTAIEGPSRVQGGLLRAGEDPLALLEIGTHEQTEQLQVGLLAMQQGLLLGCYDRCDDGTLAHVRHPNISRVHLLLLWHGETPYAIDTASTNGTFVEQHGKRIRAPLIRISDGLTLILGDDRARLCWRAIEV